jgi:hypothetical protein
MGLVRRPIIGARSALQEQYCAGTGGFAPVMVPSLIMRPTSARMNHADGMEGYAGAR